MKETRRTAWFIAFLVALAIGSAPAAAQKKGEPETRSVYGTVVDRTGEPIPKAVVHLKNAKTLQSRTYIADAKGSFHFQGLSLSTDYQVHAEHEGAASPAKTISSFDSRKELHISLKIEEKK